MVCDQTDEKTDFGGGNKVSALLTCSAGDGWRNVSAWSKSHYIATWVSLQGNGRCKRNYLASWFIKQGLFLQSTICETCEAGSGMRQDINYGGEGERETGVIPGHPKPMNYCLTASSEARKPSWEAKRSSINNDRCKWQRVLQGNALIITHCEGNKRQPMAHSSLQRFLIPIGDIQ